MKKYRCIKNYIFEHDYRTNLLCFTKGSIYEPKDDNYPSGGLLFIDDMGDDHFIDYELRYEFFVPVKNFYYGK